MVKIGLVGGVLDKREGRSFGVAYQFFDVLVIEKVLHTAIFLAVIEYFDVIGRRQEKKPTPFVGRGIEKGVFL